jgi:hypothetical protein
MTNYTPVSCGDSYEIKEFASMITDFLALQKFKFDMLESRVKFLEEKLKEKHEAIEVQELIKEIVDEDYVRDIIDDSYVQCIIDEDYITEIVRNNIRVSID